MNFFGNFHVAGRRVGEILNVEQGVPTYVGEGRPNIQYVLVLYERAYIRTYFILNLYLAKPYF